VNEGTYHEHCWSIQEIGQNARHVFAAKNSAQKQHWRHLIKDGLDLERDSTTGNKNKERERKKKKKNE